MSMCGEIENVEYEITQAKLKLESLVRRLAALKKAAAN